MVDNFDIFPEDGKYEGLKALLLARHTDILDDRADQLLNLSSLGDGDPLDLVDRITKLSGSGADMFEALKRRIFIRCLPPAARPMVSEVRAKDLTELARRAKAVIADLPMDQATMAVFNEASISSISSICCFHKKFGDLARNCQEPCSFKPKSKVGNAEAGRQ